MPSPPRRVLALRPACVGLCTVAICLAVAACRPTSIGGDAPASAAAPAAERHESDAASFGPPPVSADSLWEFEQRMQSFATGRPDLSAPPCTQRDAMVQEALAVYFTPAGLGVSDARKLLVAMNGEGLVLRFALKPRELERFLKCKRRLAETAEELWDRSGGWFTIIEVEDPTDHVTRTTWMPYLIRYPFVRLDWWPPTKADVAGMVAYEGRLRWGRIQAHPGLGYYVLVDKKDGLVYLLGW